jgi:hypothetical protein
MTDRIRDRTLVMRVISASLQAKLREKMKLSELENVSVCCALRPMAVTVVACFENYVGLFSSRFHVLLLISMVLDRSIQPRMDLLCFTFNAMIRYTRQE